MRLRFVTPRYGPDVVGGAETLARNLAEQLAAAGHDIGVLTTCATDHFTWANSLPAGETVINGVTVQRFPVTVPRDGAAMARLQPVIDGGLQLPADLEREWVRNTGHSEPLLERIDSVADNVDAVCFAPYLFASTVFGAAVRPERSLVIPCLHDEVYARFSVIQDTLSGAAGLVFNTTAEQRLAASLLPHLPPHRVVGAGLDPPGEVDPAGFRRRHRVGGEFIAYAGRRELGKNFPLLMEWVTIYDRALSHRGEVSLVVMGSGRYDVPVSAQGLVHEVGYVSHGEMLDALSGSLAVANLSLNESFSFLVLEGWSVGVPAIVHADCPVTRGHCEDSGGGLWVGSAEEFAETVDRLQGSPALARSLGEAGRAYVRDRYSWPAVVDRMESAVQELMSA